MPMQFFSCEYATEVSEYWITGVPSGYYYADWQECCCQDVLGVKQECARCEDSFACRRWDQWFAAPYTVFVLKGQTHQQRRLYMIHNKVDLVAKQESVNAASSARLLRLNHPAFNISHWISQLKAVGQNFPGFSTVECFAPNDA